MSRKIIYTYNGKRITRQELDELINRNQVNLQNDCVLPNLHMDVIYIILLHCDVKTLMIFKQICKNSILDECTHFWKQKMEQSKIQYKYKLDPYLFTYREYVNLSLTKCKVDKMLKIMKMELKLDGDEKRNGRIGCDFGEFEPHEVWRGENRKNKINNRLKILNETLTYIFNKVVNIEKECKKERLGGKFNISVDLHIGKRVRAVLLMTQEPELGDEYGSGDFYCHGVIDKHISFRKFKELLYRIMYYCKEEPCANIYGSYGSCMNDMPLTGFHLTEYINKGIRYDNKEPFYRRDRLIKSICYPV